MSSQPERQRDIPEVSGSANSFERSHIKKLNLRRLAESLVGCAAGLQEQRILKDMLAQAIFEHASI